MSFYTAFAEHYEAIFPFSDTVYTFLRRYVTPNSRCLDVGCGTGHYCGRLAADSVGAVGIDLDAAMITHAKQHYPRATFHAMNMLDIASLVSTDLSDLTEQRTIPHPPTPYSPLPTPFHSAFCIGNTAAHLSQTDFARFLDAVRQVLEPGGTWTLQVMNWDYVLTQPAFTFPVIETPDGVTFHREYRDVTEDHVIFHTRLQIGARTLFEDDVPLYPLRSAQIVQLHARAGFRSVEHCANYAGAPFDPGTFSANIFVFKG